MKTTPTNADLARRIRDHYEAGSRARRAPEPNNRVADADLGQPDGVWLTLVQRCAGRGVDPAAYVDWAFDAAADAKPEVREDRLRRGLGPLPGPRELLGPKLMTKYLAEAADRRRGLELEFRAEHDEARSAILETIQEDGATPADAQAQVLGDESVALSPLYRYCVAVALGGETFRRIAAFYEAAAARQYLQARVDYDATSWRDRIPAALKQRCSTPRPQAARP